MKKLIILCLLLLPLSALAATATVVDNAEVIQSRNAQMAKLVKDSFDSDVARLNLNTDQYMKIVEEINENKKDLAEDIRKLLDESQKRTFDQIMAEKKAALGEHVGF